jgi:hypothetical protein
MKRALLRFLLIGLAAAIGLGLGMTWQHRRGPQSLNASSTSASTQGSSRRHGHAGSAVDDSPLATKLEHDLAMSSGVTRWLYWLEAIEKAKATDFPRLVRLAHDNPAALRLVARRWAELYPRHFFDTLAAASLGDSQFPVRELDYEILFKDWPKRDPQAAIDALNGTQNFGMRNIWRDYVAETIIENDPERGLSLFAEWNIDRFGPNMKAVSKWAAEDPRHAAEFALAHPAGYASELTMDAIGKAWGATDPAGALNFAAAQPSALSSRLAAAALQQWTGANLTDAANWLAQADTRTRNSLGPAFVETWAKQDPSSALDWCQVNLTGSSQIQAVGSVLKGAADTDVNAAAALVTSLDPSPARAEAALAVAKKWFPDVLTGEPVKPEAVAWMSGLDPYSVKRVLDNFIDLHWSGTDPASMAAFLASSPNTEEVSTSTYTRLAKEMARTDAAGALAWANGLSGERAVTVGSDVFASWRSSQPEAASRWFDALPENDPRRQPFFESAVMTLAWGDPQAVQQFAAMTPAERATARSVLEKATSLPDDRRASLLQALK